MTARFIARNGEGGRIRREATSRGSDGTTAYEVVVPHSIMDSPFCEFDRHVLTKANLSGIAVGQSAVAGKRIGIRWVQLFTLAHMGSVLGLSLDVNFARSGAPSTALFTAALNFHDDPVVIPRTENERIVSANSSEAVDALAGQAVSNSSTTTVTPANDFTELIVRAETAGQFAFAFGTATPADPSTGGAGCYIEHLEKGDSIRFISAYPLSAFKCRAEQASATISWTAIDRRKKISGAYIGSRYSVVEYDFPNILWLPAAGETWWASSVNLPAAAADLDAAGGLIMHIATVVEPDAP